MSMNFLKIISSGALIGLSISFCVAAAEPPPVKRPVTAAQSEPKSPPASSAPRQSRASADARECLRLSTNVEIIRCAEKYL